MKWIRRMRYSKMGKALHKSMLIRNLYYHCIVLPYNKVFCLYANGLSMIGSKRLDGQRNDARCGLFIITVAFNHAGLIGKQIELVKQFVGDADFRHIIIDNSTQREARRNIASVCRENNVEYIAIPHIVSLMAAKNPFVNGYSHGMAINWAFRHVIKPRRPKLFMLIDHDVFPLKQVHIAERLGNNRFVGVERRRSYGWYLWPGWSIFRFDDVVGCRPDFMPLNTKKGYMDCGGRMYQRMYKHDDIGKITFPTQRLIRIKKTEGLVLRNDIYHSDCIQIIDKAWIHLINGSNCAQIEGKEETVDKIIRNILRAQMLLEE